MSQIRKAREQLNFVGAGTETITVASNQRAAVFQLDLSVSVDTTFSLKVGSKILLESAILADNTPVQFFLYGFGLGVGSGVKGEDITLTLGAAGDGWLTYILNQDPQ